MPKECIHTIVLSDEEKNELLRRAGKYTLPYYMVIRARMILLASEGASNDYIAQALQTRREIVSHWRKHFFEKRLPGLEEPLRPGRPSAFSPSGNRKQNVLDV